MLRLFTIASLLALSFVAATTRIARADDYDWWNWNMHSGSSGHYRHHRAARPRYEREVRFYRTPDAERSDIRATESYHCLERVRGLGSQWIGTEGALNAAKKDWMERVRYDHGEKYLDLGNSRDFESRCGRVSIGEVAGQVTYRCEIWAKPCKGVLKDDPDATAKDKLRDERQESIREDHEERVEQQR